MIKPFVHQVRVRYAETDQLGIAYYAHYLVWFEVARVEYLRRLGHAYRDLEKQGFKLPVVSCSIRYFAPARYDDLLNVQTTIERIGRSSVKFLYTVLHHPTQLKLAQGETVLACVNDRLEPVPFPAFLKEALAGG